MLKSKWKFKRNSISLLNSSTSPPKTNSSMKPSMMNNNIRNNSSNTMMILIFSCPRVLLSSNRHFKLKMPLALITIKLLPKCHSNHHLALNNSIRIHLEISLEAQVSQCTAKTNLPSHLWQIISHSSSNRLCKLMERMQIQKKSKELLKLKTINKR